jgi:hypothetical protein
MPRWLGFIGPWGAPPDGPAWGAVACAVVAVAVACAPRELASAFLSRLGSRAFVALCAFAAALLSLGYVAFYLRGGPRIVDATTYFLQGRALSEGHFAWSVPEPTASFRGRFLVAHEDAVRGTTIAGIFPPGYPLLLSLGFAVGAPMAVGPALAAAIVIATFALARELASEAGMDRTTTETVARLAAVFSVVSGALRYHTADTMAHGACALAFACALLAALRARGSARRNATPWMFLLAGGALGFVLATRFASALALGAVLAWLAFRAESRGAALVACALGAVPGVALLLLAQYSSTGHLFASTQRAYYAASDGPPGCFRYGFGAGVGCLFEHGDFVRARLADGYGLLAAGGTTLRRLGHHFADVANFGPLALVAYFSASRAAWRTLGVRASLALVGALVVAYAPFYFDGDYPGGGARFLADGLAVEHALLALGVARVAVSLGAPLRRLAPAAVAVASLGFGIHMAYAHEQLRTRDGGSPMFDPEVLAHAHIGPSAREHAVPGPNLVFVETDHGFDLAHDPGAIDRAARGASDDKNDKSTLFVARARGDDYDRLVYERLGHPSSWMYRYRDEPAKPSSAPSGAQRESVGSVESWHPSPAWAHGAETWRFESENEWPPLAQTGDAWAEPTWASDTCASPAGAGRVLTIHSSAGPGSAGASRGAVTIALPIPRGGKWRLTPRVLVEADQAESTIELLAPDDRLIARWDLDAGLPNGSAGATCTDLMPRPFEVKDGTALVLRITVVGQGFTGLATRRATRLATRLDRVILTTDPR